MLNPNQKRFLTTALRTFEAYLRQASLWLDGYEENGILYRRKAELSPEQRAIALERIRAALDEIARLTRLFDLETQVENAALLISGQMSVLWATIEDLRSNKLDRFGEVDPRLADLLDPAIDRLSRLALGLASFHNHSTNQEKKA